MQKQDDSLAAATNAPMITLTLLATTDLHANLHPYNYFLDQRADDLGLAGIATLVDRIRAVRPNCMLFDNGDTLQGTPLGDYAANERIADSRPHPMIAAMNVMRYDAATLGNHDFNYGLAFLTDALDGAAFPVVLANVTQKDGRAFLPPSVILTRKLQDETGASHTLRIGVIGLAPPQITLWDRPVLGGALVTHGIVATAKAAAADLHRQGADLVVALCHSGIGGETNRPDLENALLPLAREAGLGAIVAGHTHSILPAPDGDDRVFGTPVVQPGAFGSHLGEITLNLTLSPEGWRISGSDTRTHAVMGPDGPTKPNSAVLQVTAADHMATLGHIRRRIGESLVPLTSYFSTISNGADIRLITDAQHAVARSLLTNHTLRDLPLLSVASPFKSGGRGGAQNYTDIPAGPLSIRNIADLYIYPNTLQILRVKGADIVDWLERAACCFHQIMPGTQGQLLLDHSFASYNFDVMAGLTYTIDPAQPARYSAHGDDQFETPGRIGNLCYQGRPLRPDAEFLVATNSYRAAGGGHFAAPTRSDVVLDPRLTIQDILIRHVTEHSPVAPEPLATWRFASLPGTDVIVETGRNARIQTAEIASLGLTPLGFTASGFAQFQMAL